MAYINVINEPEKMIAIPKREWVLNQEDGMKHCVEKKFNHDEQVKIPVCDALFDKQHFLSQEINQSISRFIRFNEENNFRANRDFYAKILKIKPYYKDKKNHNGYVADVRNDKMFRYVNFERAREASRIQYNFVNKENPKERWVKFFVVDIDSRHINDVSDCYLDTLIKLLGVNIVIKRPDDYFGQSLQLVFMLEKVYKIPTQYTHFKPEEYIQDWARIFEDTQKMLAFLFDSDIQFKNHIGKNALSPVWMTEFKFDRLHTLGGLFSSLRKFILEMDLSDAFLQYLSTGYVDKNQRTIHYFHSHFFTPLTGNPYIIKDEKIPLGLIPEKFVDNRGRNTSSKKEQVVSTIAHQFPIYQTINFAQLAKQYEDKKKQLKENVSDPASGFEVFLNHSDSRIKNHRIIQTALKYRSRNMNGFDFLRMNAYDFFMNEIQGKGLPEEKSYELLWSFLTALSESKAGLFYYQDLPKNEISHSVSSVAQWVIAKNYSQQHKKTHSINQIYKEVNEERTLQYLSRLYRFFYTEYCHKVLDKKRLSMEEKNRAASILECSVSTIERYISLIRQYFSINVYRKQNDEQYSPDLTLEDTMGNIRHLIQQEAFYANPFANDVNSQFFLDWLKFISPYYHFKLTRCHSWDK